VVHVVDAGIQVGRPAISPGDDALMVRFDGLVAD
jgi:hypothetical protein